MGNILSIDPGDHTGWALWDNRGTLLQAGTTHSQEEFFNLLDDHKGVQTYVVEEFRLFPHMAATQFWSAFRTVENIGAVRLLAYKRGSSIVMQRPDNKTIAYKLSGITPAKSHDKSHMLDAMVHGYFYFYKAGLFKLSLADEQKKLVNG